MSAEHIWYQRMMGSSPTAAHRSQMTPVLFALNVATLPLDYIFFTRA